MSDNDAAAAGTDQTYTCAACGGTFSTDWSEEEAKAEAAETFPDAVEAGQNFHVVCDVCYQKMMKLLPPDKGRPS